MKLIQIKETESKFGSFGNQGQSDFYNILDGEYAGEVEYSPKQNEVLSIYIDKAFRGKGIGRKVINQLFDLYDTNEIFALSAKISLPFWKKVSTKKLKNNYFIIEKN
jgi:GNAT superfamily N-acetyltransferase